MRGMTVKFLKPKEAVILDEVLTRHRIEELDAYVRFWRSGKIQIDGDLSLKEMQALTEAMQLMAGIEVVGKDKQ